MMGKQAFLDLLIVLVIPSIVVGAYFIWFRGEDSTQLLSSSTGQATIPANQPGAKTEIALKTLRSVHLDDSFFKDPAYLSLKTYTVNIPTVPISRPFPFTPPTQVLERLKEAKYNSGKSSSVTPDSTTKIQAIGISSKINLLKGGR